MFCHGVWVLDAKNGHVELQHYMCQYWADLPFITRVSFYFAGSLTRLQLGFLRAPKSLAYCSVKCSKWLCLDEIGFICGICERRPKKPRMFWPVVSCVQWLFFFFFFFISKGEQLRSLSFFASCGQKSILLARWFSWSYQHLWKYIAKLISTTKKNAVFIDLRDEKPHFPFYLQWKIMCRSEILFLCQKCTIFAANSPNKNRKLLWNQTDERPTVTRVRMNTNSFFLCLHFSCWRVRPTGRGHSWGCVCMCVCVWSGVVAKEEWLNWDTDWGRGMQRTEGVVQTKPSHASNIYLCVHLRQSSHCMRLCSDDSPQMFHVWHRCSKNTPWDIMDPRKTRRMNAYWRQ